MAKVQTLFRLAADVSLSKEEQLAERLNELDIEDENDRFTQRSRREEQNKLMQAEHQLAQFLTTEPSENERRTAEEWPKIAAQLAEAKAASKFQKSESNEDQLVKFALLGVGGLITVYGFIQPAILLIVIGLLVISASIWLFVKPSKSDELPENYAEVLKKYSGNEQDYETVTQKVHAFA